MCLNKLIFRESSKYNNLLESKYTMNQPDLTLVYKRLSTQKMCLLGDTYLYYTYMYKCIYIILRLYVYMFDRIYLYILNKNNEYNQEIPQSQTADKSKAKCLISISIRRKRPGRVAQSVTYLATDACLTAYPGVASSIPVRSHTFVEIDHDPPFR